MTARFFLYYFPFYNVRSVFSLKDVKFGDVTWTQGREARTTNHPSSLQVPESILSQGPFFTNTLETQILQGHSFSPKLSLGT